MSIPKLILQEQWQRLGRPGWVGSLLLLLAIGYCALVLLPQRQHLAGLERRTTQAVEYRLRLDQGLDLPVAAPGQQVDDFYQTLPAQLDATAAIDRIYALANKERIALSRGEYALGVDPKTQLARYQIVLPVSGSYPQLRRFLHGLLAELPAVVLEEVDFRRKQIADTQLEGRIRMTLYLSRL
ncbi:GspMb/PilO family protein [Oceanisphaera sp. IT1-181]|uniref:GspMb/PilO family protein n=1 Tax=Oceanisphaera sp. IT1-181 TaxID=3081199 RepID=UPI0029C9BEAD|nr:GspMb/PilO family protein [Oceanisphaera sp. IT1-181]